MIPALSIRQPWAWLIVNGYKDIENRSWPTVFRGPFAVHAGQTMARRYYDETVASLRAAGICPSDIPPYEALDRGGIVGVARIVDCVEHSDSPWKHSDGYGFVLSDGRPVPFIPWPGRLGFFNLPRETLTL